MRVIITGGTGLIGRELAGAMGTQGHDVVILSRNPGKAGKLPPGVRAAGWDGKTAAGWGELLDVPDGDAGIVHLAGESIAEGRWNDEKKRRIRDSRVDSSRAVVEAIRQAAVKPRVLLQGSAVGYYGPHGDEVLTEDDPPGDDFLSKVCVEWEESSREAEALGVRRALLRTGIVLSPEGGALPKLLLPYRMMAGAPLGSGRQWFPWIHAADEVAAIRFLLKTGDASGAFNLTAPNPVTNQQLGDALARAVGRPNPLQALGLKVPGAVFRAALGEMADSILQGQRAVPRKLLEHGFRFRFPDLQPALRDLLA